MKNFERVKVKESKKGRERDSPVMLSVSDRGTQKKEKSHKEMRHAGWITNSPVLPAYSAHTLHEMK